MLILLILSLNVIHLQALSHRGLVAMPKRIDSVSLFHKLGYGLSKMKHVKENVVTDASTSRIPPGGPDPEHHSEPTAAMP